MIKNIMIEELKHLSFKSLGDFFAYQIGDVQLDLENAPYGGVRYPISFFIDGKLLLRFQLDVGGDAIVSETETLSRPYLQLAKECNILMPINEVFLQIVSVYQRLMG